jgi:serine protease
MRAPMPPTRRRPQHGGVAPRHHTHGTKPERESRPGWTRRTAVTLAIALAGAAMATRASAVDERVLALRFFDDNPLAQGQALSVEALRELEAASGLALQPRGRAADGAFLFEVAAHADPGTLRGALNTLRSTGALVYADVAPLHPERAADREPARALLITWRADAKRDARSALRAKIAVRLGHDVAPLQPLGGRAQRVALPRALPAAEAAQLVNLVRADADVEHVEVDRHAQPVATPSDPMFASQWNLNDAIGGIDALAAWSATTGDAQAPVAILDTGILAHPELAGRVITGYDMVASSGFSGDGDGRDPDPTDPGDFVMAAEASDPAHPLFACSVTNSTWHGTMVAGALGAAANNGIGLAAVNWTNPILDVRVMGKCGGALSDVADGIRWAAGLPVPNIPSNARPARVVNLSLAGRGPCGPILQSAVTEAIAQGAVIVAAAGNENGDVADWWPANCNGVVAVVATSKDGSRAFYSNFGERIALGAPGGGFGGSIPVLRNSGTAGANAAGYGYGQQAGSSLAAPHVSGTIALVQAVAPGLNPAEVQALVEATARGFPSVAKDQCTTATCGAGIVSAAQAVALAAGINLPVPPPPPPPPAPTIPVEPPALPEVPGPWWQRATPGVGN